LGPLGTAATNRPIVPAPGDYNDGEIGGMMVGGGKPKYTEKACLSATLSTTNPSCSARTRTRAAAVGSQRLAARAMARSSRDNIRSRDNLSSICKHIYVLAAAVCVVDTQLRHG
jgi:hypothetical protein